MKKLCVCIISSNEQELRPLINLFQKAGITFSPPEQTNDNLNVFNQAELKVNNLNINIIISLFNQATMTPLFSTFDPCLVIMTGACSGSKQVTHKGDLVICTGTFDMTTGTLTNKGILRTLQPILSNSTFMDWLRLLSVSEFNKKVTDTVKLQAQFSQTYKKQWLLRAFYEYEAMGQVVDESAIPDWLKKHGFDIKTPIASNKCVETMFGTIEVIKKTVDYLIQSRKLDNSAKIVVSKSTKEEIVKSIDLYGDYPINEFENINPIIRFGQYGYSSSYEARTYEDENKQPQSAAFIECRSISTDIIAIDRESIPLYRSTSFKNISTLLVKGVVDYADSLPDELDEDNYREYASQLSASFALEIIKNFHYPIPDSTINNLPDLTGKFIQRIDKENRDYRNKIYEYFTSGGYSRICLSGMEGIGKSTIAKHYGHYCTDRYYKYIFWLNGDSQASLESSFKTIFEKLQIKTKTSTTGTTISSNLFKTEIEKLSTETILLIYDNIDNLELVNIKPVGKNIKLLFTSNLKELNDDQTKVIPIDFLSRQESLNLIKLWNPRLGSESDGDCEELAKLLGYLPLALSHAAAYIQEAKIKIQDYIFKFNAHTPQLIDKQSDINKAALVSISLSIEQIKEKLLEKKIDIEKVNTLLSLLVFLNPDHIKSSVLEIMMGDKETNIHEIIGQLNLYSLVTSETYNPEENNIYNISIHRIVQRTCLLYMDQETKVKNLNVIHSEIQKYLSKNSNDKQVIESDDLQIIYSNILNMISHLSNISNIIESLDSQQIDFGHNLLYYQILMFAENITSSIMESINYLELIKSLVQQRKETWEPNLVDKLKDLISNSGLLESNDLKISIFIDILLKLISDSDIKSEKTSRVEQIITLISTLFKKFDNQSISSSLDIQFYSGLSTEKIKLINQTLSIDLQFNSVYILTILKDFIIGLKSTSEQEFQSIIETILSFYFKDIKFNVVTIIITSLQNSAISKYDLSGQQILEILQHTKELTTTKCSKEDIRNLITEISNLYPTIKNQSKIIKTLGNIKLFVTNKMNSNEKISIISTLSRLTTKYLFNDQTSSNWIILCQSLVDTESMSIQDITQILTEMSHFIHENPLELDRYKDIIEKSKSLQYKDPSITNQLKIIHELSIVCQGTTFEKFIEIYSTISSTIDINNTIKRVLVFFQSIETLIHLDQEEIKVAITYTKELIQENMTKKDILNILYAVTKYIFLAKGRDHYDTMVYLTKTLLNCKRTNDNIAIRIPEIVKKLFPIILGSELSKDQITLINDGLRKDIDNMELNEAIKSIIDSVALIEKSKPNFKDSIKDRIKNQLEPLQLEEIINQIGQLKFKKKYDDEEIENSYKLLVFTSTINRYNLKCDQIVKILKHIHNLNEYQCTILIFYYIGQSHVEYNLTETDLALEYAIKIDSLLKKEGILVGRIYQVLATIFPISKEWFNFKELLDQTTEIIASTFKIIDDRDVKEVLMFLISNQKNYPMEHNDMISIIKSIHSTTQGKMYFYEFSFIIEAFTFSICKMGLKVINIDQILTVISGCSPVLDSETFSEFFIKSMASNINQFDNQEKWASLKENIIKFKDYLLYDIPQDKPNLQKVDKITKQEDLDSLQAIIEIYKYDLSKVDDIIIRHTNSLFQKMKDDRNIKIGEIIKSIEMIIDKYKLEPDPLKNIIEYANWFVDSKFNFQYLLYLIEKITNIYQHGIQQKYLKSHISQIIEPVKQLVSDKMNGKDKCDLLLSISNIFQQYQLKPNQISDIIKQTKSLVGYKMQGNDVGFVISIIATYIYQNKMKKETIQEFIKLTLYLTESKKMKHKQILEVFSSLLANGTKYPLDKDFINKAHNNIHYFPLSQLLDYYYHNPIFFKQNLNHVLSVILSDTTSQDVSNIFVFLRNISSEKRNFILLQLFREYQFKEIKEVMNNKNNLNLEFDGCPDNSDSYEFNLTIDKKEDILSIQNENDKQLFSIFLYNQTGQSIADKLVDLVKHFEIKGIDILFITRQISMNLYQNQGLFYQSLKKMSALISNSKNIYLVHQSLSQCNIDEQLNGILKALEKLYLFRNEKFCCCYHVSNLIQRLQFYDFKIKNFIPILNLLLDNLNPPNTSPDSSLSSLSSFSSLSLSLSLSIDLSNEFNWIKDVTLNLFDPKSNFNSNI
ncbi:hypothetical protein CYY_002831 [Polysphondylium violaceum]|uniref:NB-ARC domain-containing protein n=1 Tax=Polysphondylium violaceum TaxID=133409 RepID=A0A8J4PYM9_9MYCE|nr:hypothetical protein CYY_002831 [Polysphondylium violaceum]